jgi:hypothetical protein
MLVPHREPRQPLFSGGLLLRKREQRYVYVGIGANVVWKFA